MKSYTLLGIFFLFVAAPSLLSAQKDSCVECHGQLADKLQAPVIAGRNDIHFQRGLSCADCHGGDRTVDDPVLAMSLQRGFVGKPKPQDVPRFCGRCHSSADFMKKFNPLLRTDQEGQYSTSVHGTLLEKGDQKVATCVSCHGYHGVLPVDDSRAPVYPTNVARTCGGCHADAKYMLSYSIPHDQTEKYLQSVHAEALMKNQDLSAATCNDCHGNHGAVPPGVTSVAYVCGTCHTRQSELFQRSVHKAAFDSMELGECVVCHKNHDIFKPSDEMLGVGERTVCIACHVEGDAGYQTARKMRQKIDELVKHITKSEELVDRAAKAGVEVSRSKFELNEAHDKLINTRVIVHSFSLGQLEPVVSSGLGVAKKAHQGGLKALEELQFRRKGLAASLIVISLSVLALHLKIRQLEKR